ncbi:MULTISPECIES: hypothetical protein [Lysobacteraceae]|uniref:Uncharacterized protein n=2 Tax=Novilysobacter TaxID=3382699 RepID=A0A7S6ZT52_9GAMM|nr:MULTISPECIES: hypothetical protein [Lysobacter]KIQ97144.1 hypothetical protein TI01_1341 [Lysobacter sp. A03]QOW20329.1 hypothetical protein INQ41_04695 [Lysobacter ciconiae]QOW22840.1 hypothetical protein INQ42_04500 [Lysobacter avium]QOW25348.1 hypothetical protein INQ43_04780 [Lysobacter sp. H23M47]QOY63532.1 hypothetical protein INQ40_04660 [Lysobacter sp. H21R4]
MTAQASNNFAIAKMVVQNLQAGDAKGGKGKSWLVAIAQALGGIMGDKAAKLVELTGKMDKLAAANPEDQKAAKQFQKTMMEFQAQSQLFSMISNASSTAIKSIGEGMTTVARKQ